MKQEPTNRDAQPLPLSNATSSVAPSSDAVMDSDWQAGAAQPALDAVTPDNLPDPEVPQYFRRQEWKSCFPPPGVQQRIAEQPALGAVPPERVLRTLNHLPIIVE